VSDVNSAFANAVERHQAGDLPAAESLYRAALTIEPGHGPTLCNLGTLLAGTNRPDEAAACYRQCLAVNHGYADAHYNFGNLLRRGGHGPEAVEQYQLCLQAHPQHIGAQYNLGLVLAGLNQLASAGDCFRKVIAHSPNYADAHNRLGDILLRTGHAEAGVDAFRRYIELKPEDHRGYNNLALGLANLGQPQQAVEWLQRALHMKPDYAEAHNTLGLAYDQMGKKDEAAASYRRATELKPEYADAWSNLGTNLTEAGRIDEAIEALRRSVHARPDAAPIHSNLLLTLNYSSNITPEIIAEEHRQWAARHAPGEVLHRPAVDRTPNRKLNIGYVSADFRSHTVAGFIEILLKHHDRSRFNVTAYANQARFDDTSERLKKLADRFRPIMGLSDSAAVEMIRADDIDILIDLSGHTAGHRLELFARKPAALQMTLFGYPNTSGLRSMDYRITDDVADPPGTSETLGTEKLLRLSTLAWAYMPPKDAPEVGPLPNLKAKSLTLGCLNNPAKISDHCLETWAKLMATIPDARLVILAGQSAAGAQRLQSRFTAAGVGRDRLDFIFRLPPKDYLEIHNLIDLMLDPFPYNGGVTTCDALWMGVPVLTVAGNTYASRQGASILTHVGVSEFIADTPERLIDLAVTWATNKELLGDIRHGLRGQMQKSPVCDAKEYIFALETGYAKAWNAMLSGN
jgi:predicted O-linked N-acetylglucosamine transferase (SPINDLY family)